MSQINQNTILSLDQSTRKTGWSCFINSDLYKWGLIDIPQNVPADNRMLEILHQVELLLQKYRPRLVVIEEVTDQRSPRTLILLARLQGMIIGLCDRYHVDVEILAPTTWRATLEFQQGRGVRRDELKQQAFEFIRNSYGLTVGEDICESMCIGLAYLKRLGMLPNFEDLHRASGPNRDKE